MKSIHDAFNAGAEEFAKYCLRYGTIIRDQSGEYYKGQWRKYVIIVDGWYAYITKENGVTTGAMMKGELL